MKDLVKEAKVSASSEYQKKEKLREGIQNVFADLVKSKVISSQKEFDILVNDVDMIMKTLKLIPYEVWEKLAKIKK